MIDAHSQVDHLVALDRVIELMDRGGVSRTILSARGRLAPDQLVSIAAGNSDRITPAVRTKGWPYARNEPKYYKLLENQLARPQFTAMAEVIVFHARKGTKAPRWSVPLDSQQVQAALRAALNRRWPFVVHIEFAAAGRDRDELMQGFERMLAAHRGHPFVLIHMGQLPLEDVRRLIGVHENVYFLTSHSNSVTVAKSRQPWVNLFDGERLLPAWKSLVIGHPDRFILAFDNVFKEHWGTPYLRQIALWRKAFEELPIDVAHAVAHGNAERLWRLPAAK